MLAIDDSPTYLAFLSQELDKDGYRIDTVTAGQEGLARIAATHYDGALVDLMMPEMDGIEVTRRILEIRPFHEDPIVILMLTARETKEDLTRALDAGADDFVGKSSDMAVIRVRIRALLRRKFFQEENKRILEEMKSKELEAVRARADQEAAETRAALADELSRLAEELKRSNRELEAFSYSVSHDLRAPLRAINGFSVALAQDCKDCLDDRGRDYLRRIRVATQQMGQLIEDMLELSRVSRSDIHYESVDLSSLAESIFEEIKGADPSRCAELKVQEELVAWGDPRLLRVLLDNLLRNAWKFTSKHPASKIEVGSWQQGEKQVYFVRDDGAGFNMDYADRLFSPFQRLHLSSEFPGTGVGLATVQRIVHRHGGEIWAKAEVDKGATFHFTLSKSSQR